MNVSNSNLKKNLCAHIILYITYIHIHTQKYIHIYIYTYIHIHTGVTKLEDYIMINGKRIKKKKSWMGSC